MKYILLLICLIGPAALAATTSLEKELKDLDSNDSVPQVRLPERLYSVQTRIVPLDNRVEVLVGAGHVFAGNDFLSSNQYGVEAQYHFNESWAMALAYSKISNSFTSAAHNVEDSIGFLPDVDYARSRYEARAQYNLFYGKIRFSRDSALTFDQYFGAGVAANDLASGTSVGPVGDLGFAFWMTRHLTSHVGVKDYFYQENRLLSKGWTNNAQAYLQFGAIF